MKKFELIKEKEIFKIGKSQYYRYKKNGLGLILLKNNIAPVTTFHIWYNVGSGDEVGTKTGIAHYLEHMMFRGTKKYPVGEFDKILDETGARGSNAFTSMDYTAYVVDIPSKSIELVFELESDRMKNIEITEEVLDIERGAILSERAMMVEDDPYGYMWELLFSNLYKNNGYNHDTIGWKKDIETISVNDLKMFYNNYYSPNNANIVIIGDFEKDNILNLVDKYFGEIEKSKNLKEIDRVDNFSANNTIIKKRFHVSTPKMLIAYKTVGLNNLDFIKLKLLSIILYDINSAVLKEKFLSKNRVIYIASDIISMKELSVFYIEVDLKKEEDSKKLLKDIESEILDIMINLDNEKLELAKTKFKVSKLGEYSTNDSIATLFGESTILTGSPYHNLELIENISSITVESIKEVIESYLKIKKRVTVILEPKE